MRIQLALHVLRCPKCAFPFFCPKAYTLLSRYKDRFH